MDLNKKHKLQVFKFGLYGFLKNLKFFEPYLLIYFALVGLSLFQIGLLFSIREIIIYIFEIPSGVFADRYGKKTELVICFIFYIISFLIFFLASNFLTLTLAMIFFALGEALRSGTHKTMIMVYLDRNEIIESKSQVYGKTRGFSLIGSMVASLISIIFVIWLPDIKFLFLLAIIPYLGDLLLIISYPKYMNERHDSKFNFIEFIKHNFRSIKYAITNKNVNGLILSSASFNAGFKSIKDYIQPILITISLGFVMFTRYTEDENTTIYVGFIYAIIYLISAFVSKNAYKLKDKFGADSIINSMWLFSGIALFILSFFINNVIVVFSVFLALYVFLNLRRPLMIEKIGDKSDRNLRASVLSIQAQFTSLLLAILAPIIGLIADYSMKLLFFIIGIIMIIIYLLSLFVKRKNIGVVEE